MATIDHIFFCYLTAPEACRRRQHIFNRSVKIGDRLSWHCARHIFLSKPLFPLYDERFGEKLSQLMRTSLTAYYLRSLSPVRSSLMSSAFSLRVSNKLVFWELSILGFSRSLIVLKTSPVFSLA